MVWIGFSGYWSVMVGFQDKLDLVFLRIGYLINDCIDNQSLNQKYFVKVWNAIAVLLYFSASVFTEICVSIAKVDCKNTGCG